jgi:hypothetical protein
MKRLWRPFLTTIVAAIALYGLSTVVIKISQVYDTRYLASILEAAHAEGLKVGVHEGSEDKNTTRIIFRNCCSGGLMDPEILVAVDSKGKMAVLWKKYPGWHHNYRGLVYIEEGYIFTVEPDYYGRSVLSIDFKDGEPVIRRMVSRNLYEVFFDLG